MTVQHNQPALSAGRCPNTGDGDTGTRARSATHGQEACSLNNTANSPPGARSDLAQPAPTQQLGPEAPPPNSGSALTGGGAPNPNTGGENGTAQTQNVNDGRGANGEQNERGNQAPPTQGTSSRGGAKTKPTLRAGTKIASLNMKGYGNEPSRTDIVSEKWKHVQQMMREKKIAVLCVQEAHMDEERRRAVEKLFPKLSVYVTEDPIKPRARNRLAIVVNREQITDPEPPKTQVIVEGRAMSIQLKLHRGTPVVLLGIYAPNEVRENIDFWKEIRTFYQGVDQDKKPSIIAGNMNMVEDAIDRLPVHTDDHRAVDSLNRLKTEMSLIDGWRDTFPTRVAFTFNQAGNVSHSRIDRIYVTQPILDTAQEWNIEPYGIPGADHDGVSVVVVDTDTPNTSRGRRTIPEFLLKDKIFMEKVAEAGCRAKREADQQPENIQWIWKHFKDDVLKMAKA
jgi:exonuclease III